MKGVENAAMLREHCKTDWYRYNLKRKVAGLAPLPREAYEERAAREECMVTGEVLAVDRKVAGVVQADAAVPLLAGRVRWLV